MRYYNSPLGVWPFQAEHSAIAYTRRDILADWECGLGKALRNDQRVCTPYGWTPIGKLSVGDEVIGSNGLPCNVVGVYPQGVRSLYRVTLQDGSSVIADAQHRWTVARKQRNPGLPETRSWVWDKIVTTEEMLRTGVRRGREHRYRLPTVSPVEFAPQDLPIDPYTLGVLIGDGGLTQSPRLTTMDRDMIPHLVLGDGVEIHERDHVGLAQTYLFATKKGAPNPLLDNIRALHLNCKSEHKFIPPPYLIGSVTQRFSLLQGLLDTDGYAGDSISFSSSSHRLADDVCELVRSLGGTASVRPKVTPRLVHYRVSICLPSSLGNPFRIERKAREWKKSARFEPKRIVVDISPVDSDEATCIRVDADDALFVTEDYIVTHNSHLAMVLIALLLEDDLIDMAVLVAEKNKLVATEWPKELETYTSFDWKLYYGTPRKREKIRADLPQVLLTSYDVVKRDAAVFPPSRKKLSRMHPTPGPLLDVLAGKRILVIYDETTRIANRTSDTYKAHKLFIDTLREEGDCRVMAMTATAMERDPESFFNLGRIISPWSMPTVDQFNREYVSLFDVFNNPCRFKNLSASDCDPGVIPLRDRMAPIMLTKRKSDPDVVEFFPKKRELAPIFVDLGDTHQEFYDTVADIAQGLPEEDQKPFSTVLRQIAAHPMAIANSQGAISRTIVDQVGIAGLEAMGSAKTDRMVSWCNEVVKDQGTQAVIFTFFAQSVLPLLQARLLDEGYTVSINHGEMSQTAKADSQRSFRGGETQIFLTGDAGSKGINLPEATYLLHYERPPTHSNFIQRSDRLHRIDSEAAAIFIYSLVARSTIEEGLYGLSLLRNEWQDLLLGDNENDQEQFLTAEDRKLLFRISRDKQGATA